MKPKKGTEIKEQKEKKIFKKITKKVSNTGVKIQRVSTGIKNFNLLIEGGFEKDSINLIVGGSGCGKSIFSIEFLVEGIKNGEKALYVAFEEKKKDFYTNMGEFGIDLNKLEKQGKFFFLQYTPEKVRTMLEEGGGTIENIVLRKKINRIVVDSITSFELLFDKKIEKREAALSLFSLLRKWNCTTLLTYEDIPSPGKKPASRELDFEADSIILLYFLREGRGRIRLLEILKMRGTDHSLNLHKYDIGGDGIVVDPKPYTRKLTI